MTSFPISSTKDRLCCRFPLSGLPRGGRCEEFPCMHTETYDLDWLSDIEEHHSNKLLHTLMWVCYRHPEILEECKALEPALFQQLEAGYHRCQRIQAKEEKIEADYDEHQRRLMDEVRRYFAYYEGGPTGRVTKRCGVQSKI
jgi:hypothetical protein